jgi:hypothetical protein
MRIQQITRRISAISVTCICKKYGDPGKLTIGGRLGMENNGRGGLHDRLTCENCTYMVPHADPFCTILEPPVYLILLNYVSYPTT